LDIYELGKEIARRHLQIAVVGSHDASSDDVHFLETVDSNRGGVILFFGYQDDANAWLRVTNQLSRRNDCDRWLREKLSIQSHFHRQETLHASQV